MDEQIRKVHQGQAHMSKKHRVEFRLWQVLTSSWARHPMGFQKAHPFTLKHRKEFEALDKQIRDHWESVKQPEWEYRHKVAFKNKLERILADFLTRPLKLVITGSTVSGVGTANSDADIVLCAPEIIYPLPRDMEDDGRLFTISKDEMKRLFRSRIGVVLRRCKRVLDEADLGVKIDYVDAQIPLLKMRGETVDEVTGNTFNMEVDLSLSNELFISSLHNTHLIKGYTKVDERFAPLVTLVKMWSFISGVRDPQRRRFNSYTMTLLVIHFLQCGLPRPILPNLQAMFSEFYALDENCFPERVDLDADIPEPLPELIGYDPIGLSVAELFYLFIAYYSTLDLRHNVIRIKCGRISKRDFNNDRQPRYEPMRMVEDDDENDIKLTPWPHRFHEVYIEDPIDEHNPGRTVDDWEIVRNAFADTLNVFNRIDDPEQAKHFLFPDLEDLTGIKE
ncbi:mut-2 [Pristionchus pacificus]|uniref:Mut-2 n=1 Tax=Pristionchus pacificus TaxID=54126 RepID=A0A2A6BZU4_PRIPA|nr:mut-2 [Pristionchus pacificus]|eukprot:PDM71418.1 mut-2 [Pristionchus pacificus]